MSQFGIYFELGCEHILDWKNGYDHILFVIALCAVYVVRDWKRVLILVTAFTIGHSITLALSGLKIITLDATLIEFLIPVTIFLTAVANFFHSEHRINKSNIHLNYLLAAGFGLIHGMGFSNFFRELTGNTNKVLSLLFPFNVGLEFGQIVIVGLFMAVTFLVVELARLPRRFWRIGISAVIALMALLLIKDSAYLNS
jgi:hypothetical protein